MPADAPLRARDFLSASARLKKRIARLQHDHPQPFAWYPYDSFSNADQIVRLFAERHEFLFDLARRDGVYDIGCADGAMSFLFESVGCPVTVIDYSGTNHNAMRGVRALKNLLGSSVKILDMDLDREFSLPRGSRGLTLFLGILYHLKNPYQAMERLASKTSFCLLSTRIARCFPGGKPMPPDQPIAYLVGAEELNADDTNYWIFSQAGLERLFERTHWKIVQSFSIGDLSKSDPANPKHDERYFCLLRSHFGLANVELLDGWYPVEVEGWRWTRRTFSLCASFDSGVDPERIAIQLYLPPAIFEQLGPVTLSGRVNGESLPPVMMERAGDHRFEWRLRAAGRAPRFTFELDRVIAPRPDDPRELGIVVAQVVVE